MTGSGTPRALVGGFFSFGGKVTTAGDLLACQVATEWLRRAGVEVEVALAPKYGDGVDWERVDPAQYSHVIWVCGPMTKGPRQTAFRERFAGARLVALDVSVLDELGDWSPYDAVVERDSATTARPDISVLAEAEPAPVVGLCVIARQREYGERGRHDAVTEAFRRLIESRPMGVVEIDTTIKPGKPGRRHPAEVEGLLSHVDVVLTNRLHGLVLAIKHGVPAVAVDSVAEGAKVRRQAEAIEWPVILAGESLDDAELQRAFEWCLTEEARAAAREARQRAINRAGMVERMFVEALELGRE
jgi:hypothetical protein